MGAEVLRHVGTPAVWPPRLALAKLLLPSRGEWNLPPAHLPPLPWQDQDASGVSPLHLAARFAHPVLVEWLLREGHAATLETLEGALPLHHAAVSGDLTCLKLLTAAHGR